jgi:glutathione S-transferase
MSKITLYQYEISPYADKVRRVLKLKNLDYQVVEVLASKAKKYKHISPTLKFPALRYGEETVVDSTDILTFLDEKHPEPKIIPDSAHDQAIAHIIEDWADESLYFYDLAIRAKPQNVNLLKDDILKYETGFSRKLMDWVLPKAANKIANTQGLGRKDTQTLRIEIQNHFEALETILRESDWLCGTALSTADISIVSMLHVLIRAKEPAELLPNYPRLADLKSRIDALTF